MQLFVLILKKVEIVDELLTKLASVGVKGGTVLDGAGMAKSLSTTNNSGFFNLFKDVFIDEVREKSKVLLFVLKDEQIDTIKDTVHTFLGTFQQPNTGIMFSIPVNFVEGLSKNYDDK